MVKKVFVTTGKALATIILGLFSITFGLFLYSCAGFAVASTISQVNELTVVLGYFSLVGLFAFLIIRAEIPANDVGPEGLAMMMSWIYAGIGIKIIYSIHAMGNLFTGINLGIFLITVMTLCIWQKNKYPNIKTTKKLNDKALFVIVTGGIMQGVIAFGLYKLNLFIS